MSDTTRVIESQVVIFDNDMDEELLLIQERAAEAIAAVVQEGAKACVQARYLSSGPGCCSNHRHWVGIAQLQ